MDLEAYIGRYRGETRLQRLLHIGKTASEASTVTHAYELAEAQMKEDGNVLRYKEVFGDDNGPSPSHPRARSGNVIFDHEFITQTDARNRSTRDMLTGRLTTAQAHLNKEAIRTAYLALAEADVLRGDLTEAFHAALRAKDYCTNRAQTSQVSFLVLEVAIHWQNYAQVKDFCFKVQHTLLPGGVAPIVSASAQSHDNHHGNSPMSPQQQQHQQQQQQQTTADKLLVASALERLAQGDYSEAASKFRQVCSHRNAWEWETLIAPEDIATYAAITSMATASRNVLMNWMEHPETLEFLAPALQDAMFQLAARANYAAAWKRLEECKSLLEMDVFLAPHVPKLFQKIREACILEYWVPYERIQLPKMAQDLNVPQAELTSLIETLMCQGAMKHCRMDCRSHCLVRDNDNQNEKKPARETRRKLNRLGQQVMDDSYAMVVRLACVEHDLIVVDPQQKDRGNGRQNRRGGGGGGGGGGPDAYDDDDDSSDGDTPMVDVSSQPVIIGDDQANPEDAY